jgi:hypothetical protein
MKIYFCAILFLLFAGCNKREGNYSNNNLNCPDYYSKIENVYCADHEFVDSSDSTHQYWYRLVTFSEEEGFVIIVEKLRQGIAEGMGNLEVVEQNNITHLKGIDDVNGISQHFKFIKWMDPKQFILELEEQSNEDNTHYKIVNLENLTVKDSILK